MRKQSANCYSLTIRQTRFSSTPQGRVRECSVSRWEAGVLVAGLFLLSKAEKHWLGVFQGEDETVFQLSKTNYSRIIEAVEAEDRHGLDELGCLFTVDHADGVVPLVRRDHRAGHEGFAVVRVGHLIQIRPVFKINRNLQLGGLDNAFEAFPAPGPLPNTTVAEKGRSRFLAATNKQGFRLPLPTNCVRPGSSTCHRTALGIVHVPPLHISGTTRCRAMETSTQGSCFCPAYSPQALVASRTP